MAEDHGVVLEINPENGTSESPTTTTPLRWLLCSFRPVPRKFTFLELGHLLTSGRTAAGRLTPDWLHHSALLLYTYFLHVTYHSLTFLLGNVGVILGIADGVVTFIAVWCFGPLLRLRLLCCCSSCCFRCFRRCCCFCCFCCCGEAPITVDQSKWRNLEPLLLQPDYWVV